MVGKTPIRKTTTIFSLIIIGLLIWPQLALSAPAHMNVELSKSGLDYLGRVLPQHLPRQFATPAASKKLFACVKAEIRAGYLTVDVHALTITPQANRLTVHLVASFRGAAGAKAKFCIGSKSATVNARASNVSATATFTPQIVNGQLKLLNPTTTINISTGQTKIWLTGGGLAGAVVNGLISLFKGMIVGKVRSAMRDMAQTKMAPLLEDALRGATRFNQTFDNKYAVNASINRIDTQAKGIAVAAKGTVKALQRAACTGAAPLPAAVPLTTDAKLAMVAGEHLGMALSSVTIGEALNAAWASGLLCISDAQIAQLNVKQADLNLAGALLGLKSVGKLGVKVNNPPQVTLIQGQTDARLKITVPQMELSLDGQGIKGPTTLTITSDAEAVVKLHLDAGKQALILDLVSAELKNVSAKATDPFGLMLKPQVLGPLLNATIKVKLLGSLTGLKVAPQSFSAKKGPMAKHYFFLTRAQTDPAYAYIYGKLMDMPPKDKAPPMVTFNATVPASAFGQATIVSVSATDDLTPAGLLRYSFSINGGKFSTPSHSSKITLPNTHGPQEVTVTAIDINGNRAAEVKKVISVDLKAPEITFATQLPATITSGAEAKASWTVLDETTGQDKVEIKVQVRDNTVGDFLLNTPFTAGTLELPSLDLSGRQPGAELELRIFARDAAGNLSPVKSALFTYNGPYVDPSKQVLADDDDDPSLGNQGGVIEGGCAIAASGETADLTLVALLLMALLLVSRRRRGDR